MEIRLAAPADRASLTALALGFRNHLERAAPSEAQFDASIAQLLGSGEAAFALALDGGVPVGYVLLRYRHSMWASGTEATLEDLYVDPAARRGGAGRALVAFALERARARGCATICLDTNEHNAASTAIYTGLGFSAESRRWNGRQLFFRLNLQDPVL